jgi:hypothetical protein
LNKRSKKLSLNIAVLVKRPVAQIQKSFLVLFFQKRTSCLPTVADPDFGD